MDDVPIASSLDLCLPADQRPAQHCILYLTTRLDDAFRHAAVTDLAICADGCMRTDRGIRYFSSRVNKRWINNINLLTCVSIYLFTDLIQQQFICIQGRFDRARIEPRADLLSAHLCTALDHDRDGICEEVFAFEHDAALHLVFDGSQQ